MANWKSNTLLEFLFLPLSLRLNPPMETNLFDQKATLESSGNGNIILSVSSSSFLFTAFLKSKSNHWKNLKIAFPRSLPVTVAVLYEHLKSKCLLLHYLFEIIINLGNSDELVESSE